MRKRKRRPVDRAQRLLGILGWSYGDLSYRRRDGHCVWQVYAQRSGERIVARAWTEVAAWDEALRQASIVQRAG